MCCGHIVRIFRVRLLIFRWLVVPPRRVAALLLRVLPNDLDSSSAAVAAELGAIQQKLPPIHLPTVSDRQRQEFLQTRYYDIVAQIIATRPANSTTPSFKFIPQIPPSDISVGDERASATALLREVAADDVEELQAAVEA